MLWYIKYHPPGLQILSSASEILKKPTVPYWTDTTYLSLSEGGFLKARMIFPQEFPLRPPKFKVGLSHMIRIVIYFTEHRLMESNFQFNTPMWHPNGIHCTPTFVLSFCLDWKAFRYLASLRRRYTLHINSPWARGRSMGLRRCWWKVVACSYSRIDCRPFPSGRLGRFL